MSDKLITLEQMKTWFEDLDEQLKDRIVATGLADKEGREEVYHLYQASQLLRARMLGDFSTEIEIEHQQYDN